MTTTDHRGKYLERLMLNRGHKPADVARLVHLDRSTITRYLAGVRGARGIETCIHLYCYRTRQKYVPPEGEDACESEASSPPQSSSSSEDAR